MNTLLQQGRKAVVVVLSYPIAFSMHSRRHMVVIAAITVLYKPVKQDYINDMNQ